jgi:hypothetical protein
VNTCNAVFRFPHPCAWSQPSPTNPKKKRSSKNLLTKKRSKPNLIQSRKPKASRMVMPVAVVVVVAAVVVAAMIVRKVKQKAKLRRPQATKPKRKPIRKAAKTVPSMGKPLASSPLKVSTSPKAKPKTAPAAVAGIVLDATVGAATKSQSKPLKVKRQPNLQKYQQSNRANAHPAKKEPRAHRAKAVVTRAIVVIVDHAVNAATDHPANNLNW